ncbi:MAG TPA: hypothetical protein VFV19_01565 [Candidatus Polarisedimenticolaceae bacterium]|nr:hypothetical protein [Candidatus Polarisedimenticolaceae bacterium]
MIPFVLLAGLAAFAADKAPGLDAGVISGLGIRNIGSATMSGRIAAVAATHGKDGETIVYVGAASGGVWKSTDGGTTFTPKFDHEKVQSIGAVAIDPSDHETIWVGTGEAWTRNSVSIGDGIYRSKDGGETWTNTGLPESERIVKIAIHPQDGKTVYACVTGKLWSDSTDRGVYRTKDGGTTWTQVLKGGNASTGCGGMSMDAKNPGTLYASLWDFRRKGWTFRSGGENASAVSMSGLYRTDDGGDHWTEITEAANKGFPAKPYGRIAVAVAPSDPKVVYAFVESVSGAIYRSADGGATWERRDNSQNMVWRPFYFANLIVDPTNPDRLFKPDGSLIQSLDGGKTFANVGGGAHGDFHDVWIDPENPKQVITGDDGGLWFSKDGGDRWWKGNNLPVSQFYHVSVDDQDPYNVYGGLQDNSSWVAPSAYPGGIGNQQWENMYGGDGFWMFADPSDPNYLYAEAQGGSIGRVNRKTHEARDIQPRANYNEKLRWNWNTPIHMSRNEKGTLYVGSQFLFKSRDHGQTWDRISPDLTTNDPEKQKQEESGGITVDNSVAEMHTTIYAISESPKDGKVVWVGTDDGNVQVTKDGGKSWKNVTAKSGVPANSWVSYVDAGQFDAGTAYVTFDRHTFGDMRPMIYKTTNYGDSWTPLVTPDKAKGLRGYAHVVREDPVKKGLLYAGTEFGLWISNDDGATWAQFTGGDFPSVAVRDLAVQVRDRDLVVATHGRGIWIIDDLTPLRALTPDVMAQEAVFLPIRPQQQRIRAGGGWVDGDAAWSGPNPSNGVDITYYQKSRHIFGKLKLEVLDDKGNVLDTLPASKRRGINRVTWNMSVKPPRVPTAAQLARSAFSGPRVVPGTYTVRMTKGKNTYETKIAIGLDPRSPFTAADRKAQFDAAMKVHGMFGEMTDLTAQVMAVRQGALAVSTQVQDGDPLKTDLADVSDGADTIRKKIVATKEGGAITGEERLREHMDDLYGAIVGYEGKPAETLISYSDALKRELGDVSNEFEAFRKDKVAKVDAELAKKGLPKIGPDIKTKGEDK